MYKRQNVGYPISLSRGAYWLGRAYEKIGDLDSSKSWYLEATKYLTTYYGQLAFLKVNQKNKFELSDQMKIDDKFRKLFYEKDLVKIVFLLNLVISHIRKHTQRLKTHNAALKQV